MQSDQHPQGDRPLLRLLILPLLLLAFRAEGQGASALSLATRVETIIGAAPFQHAVWGIEIEDDRGTTLYEHNAHLLMVPASNRKLFAAAAISSCIGLDARLNTELFLDGKDLVLRGGGDPSLGGRWAWDRDAVFAPFVAALRGRGITVIAGDLVADVSQFDRTILPGSWKLGNIGEDYAAPADALAYNENVVGVVIDHCETPLVRTDPDFVPATASVVCAAESNAVIRSDATNAIRVEGVVRSPLEALPAITSPALYAAQALRDALRHAGIVVQGTIRVNATPRSWSERIAVLPSPPVSLLLSVMLQPSQNLYAEMLYKELAAGTLPATYAAASAIERRFLIDEAGIDGSEFHFSDGSGLSPDDLVTPRAVVQLLHWIDRPGSGGVWWQLLAAPGEEGTLRKRLLPLASRLRGKTGSLAGVNALSGIVRGTDGHSRYFSIVINHHLAGTRQTLQAIDAIAEEVSNF